MTKEKLQLIVNIAGVLFGMMITVLVGGGGYMLKTVIEDTKTNTIAIAAIEANRFKAQHGQEVWREIARIRETIAALPPDRFEEMLDRRFGEMEKRFDEVAQRLVAVEKIVERSH